MISNQIENDRKTFVSDPGRRRVESDSSHEPAAHSEGGGEHYVHHPQQQPLVVTASLELTSILNAINSMNANLSTEIGNLRTELRTEIDNVRAEMQAGFSIVNRKIMNMERKLKADIDVGRCRCATNKPIGIIYEENIFVDGPEEEEYGEPETEEDQIPIDHRCCEDETRPDSV